jgi:Flp pilus assembly protein TadG
MRLIANHAHCIGLRPRAGAAVLRRLARAQSGSAAIEFAFVGSILVVLLLNVVDFSRMIWTQMEVENSAQIGAQAAYQTCAGGSMPATTNCPTLASVVTTAIQSTSLGATVRLASGSPGENYYCTNENTLQSVGTYSSPPSPFNCSATGNASDSPGDYVSVNVTYNFTPLFAGLSLAPTRVLTGAAIMRLR